MSENLSKFKIKEEGGDFYHSEIAELERPIQVVLKEMLKNIERGDYDLIIGIDSSGRVPTLIIKQFLDYVYSKKSFNLPDARFIAGNVSKETAKKKIQEWNPRKKVLIVEDTIATGDSIKFLCQALRENNVSFDVATVGTTGVYSDTSEIKEELKEKLGIKNIYFGVVGSPNIYGRQDLSGVVKEGRGEPFAEPYKKVEEHSDSSNDIQESINEARADADIVVNNLIDWYESQKHEEK